MQGLKSKLMDFLAAVMPVVWALVMALALAPLLAACGGGGSDAPAPAADR